MPAPTLSAKKQKEHAAQVSRAARDALAGNDAKTLRQLMGAAPFFTSWKLFEGDWLDSLAEGLARGSRSAQAQEALWELLKDAPDSTEPAIWSRALRRAWARPAENGVDPFTELLALRAARQAKKETKNTDGKGPAAAAAWQPSGLWGPEGTPERWRESLAIDPTLASPFWAAAVGGLGDAFADPGLRRRTLGEPERDPAELLASSQELGRQAIAQMSVSEREQLLGALCASQAWPREASEPPASRESDRHIEMPARGFNAACALLEEQGARWDARRLGRKDGGAKAVADAERAATKRIKEAGAQVAALAKAAAGVEPDEALRQAQEKLEEAQAALRQASRAQYSGHALIEQDFAPGWARARAQLGNEAFWALFREQLTGANGKGNSILRHHQEEPGAPEGKKWLAMLLRADPNPPKAIAAQALRATLWAAFTSAGRVPMAASIAVWAPHCDFKGTTLARWISWPANGVGRTRSLPSREDFGGECERISAPKSSDPMNAMDKIAWALLAEAISELSQLGVPCPWKAQDLKTPKTPFGHMLLSALESAELRELADEARRGREASPAPAEPSGQGEKDKPSPRGALRV